MKIGTLALEVISSHTEGEIVAVISHSALIRFGDFSITLAQGKLALPLGIVVPFLPGKDWMRDWVGKAVIYTGSQLMIERGIWTVDLSTAQVWDSNSRFDKIQVNLETGREALAWAMEYIRTGIKPRQRNRALVPWSNLWATDCEGEIWDSLRSASALLRRGLLNRDKQLTCQATMHLIGAGPGLTPSGDDFLIGLLLALRLADSCEQSSLDHIRQSLCALVDAVAPATTNIHARSYLYAACRGQAAEVVTDAIHGVMTMGKGGKSPLRKLLSFGGSSGWDTLAGICVGLEAIYFA